MGAKNTKMDNIFSQPLGSTEVQDMCPIIMSLRSEREENLL